MAKNFRAKNNIETVLNAINGRVPRKVAKASAYLGKKILLRNGCALPFHTKDDNRVYQEIYNIVQIERHQGMPEVEDLNIRFTRHHIVAPELGLETAISYDAKLLSTGNRGIYRHIFNEEGKYFGLARHQKSSAGELYHWVD